MRWTAIAWLFVLAAVGCSAPLGRIEPESDAPAPQQHLGMNSTDLQPTAASDAGAAPDAEVFSAADGGKTASLMPDSPPPAKPVDPPPTPAPPPQPLTLSFSPAGGGFAAPVDLTLKADDTAAEVHYTLDGSIPDRTSAVVKGAIHLEQTTLVRAVAVRGDELGAVVNQVYFQVAADARELQSDLPVIVIDLQKNPVPDPSSRDYTGAVLGVFDAGAPLAGKATLTSRVGIKVRGRSTRNQDKHSYTIELWGREQEDAPAPLLGMPSDGDWVLYAPYVADPSLMHNAFGYAVSRNIGRYAPRTAFCELFLVSDASGVAQASYAGIYVLTERISRGAQRVPVKKLEPDDISAPSVTGGYIIQMNEPDEPDEGFIAAGNRFLYVHPKQDDEVPEQTAYISGYLDSVARALSAADGVDPMTGQHYRDLIDVPAFIDHHILNVLVKNPDAFALSSYFYKDRSGPLAAGPLWDLDLALAANDPFGQRSIDPTQWSPPGQDFFRRSFWAALFTHAEFESAYWARWRELLAGPLQVAQLQQLITNLEQQVANAEPRNSARWPESAPVISSSDEADSLRAWIKARIEWISANVGTLPAP